MGVAKALNTWPSHTGCRISWVARGNRGKQLSTYLTVKIDEKGTVPEKKSAKANFYVV